MANQPPFALDSTLVLAVTGHRVIAAPQVVRLKLDELISLIAKAPVAGKARLRIISPLAEGADRLLAEAGLAAGAGLHCPLPFHRKEYAKDFADPASKAAFTALLARADRVLELGGEVHRREDAYAEIGRLVASRCDLLVAVWDGHPSRGKGGTAEVVAEALRQGVLVAHVDPEGVRPTVLLDGQAHHGKPSALEDLGHRLDSLLTPPSGPGGGNLRGVMRAILDGAGFASGRLGPSRAHWVGLFSADQSLNAACAPCVDGAALEIFARSDTLANDFARLYRRTYWLNFVLGAIAIAMALIGARASHPIFAISELIAIIAIIATTTIANVRNWHEQWIECRRIAEQLRPLRFLFPLGLAMPRARANRSAEGHEQREAWTDWLVRRIDVALGFPSAIVTPAYLEAVRQFVAKDVLDDQIHYHTVKAKRMRAADAAMHALGVGLFILTALICALEILVWGLRYGGANALVRPLEAMQPILLLISGLAPAVGAALIGVRNVGEYARLERRSDAMAAALDRSRRSLDRESAEHRGYDWLSGHLEALAAQMMSETADWRTLVITRRIELVG